MYHSYFVANLRISLGVEVRAGKEQAASHGLLGMWRTLERLPRENWPTFVRGDCGNGNKAVMRECEERSMPYLFKLRHTERVKELVRSITERWSTHECWALLLTRILRRWLGGKWLFGVPEDAQLLLSG
jgi:hypothetical protein